MSFHYTLRVTCEYDAVHSWVTSKNMSGMAVRELGKNGDNEHWHFYLECQYKDVQTVRCLLTRAVPALKGNKSYSVKPAPEPERLCQYMCKGSSKTSLPEVTWYHGLLCTPARIEQWHAAYWAENREIVQRYADEKKRKRENIIDTLVAYCKENQIKSDDDIAIARAYIRERASRRLGCDRYDTRRAVHTVQVLLDPHGDVEHNLALTWMRT